MSSIVLDAISRLTGNDFLSRCIKLCGFEDFSELIRIDEKTMDNMEIFIQKKCSRMPLNERRNFIGDNFSENPDLFKFSPGIRQKFLNVMDNLSKIFTTSNLPFSLNNLKEICQKYEINDRSALTSIPRNALKMVLSNENVSAEFVNNNPIKSVSIIDEPVMTAVTQNKVIKKPFEPYPNIFQRMDLLRKGEIEVNKNVEDKKIEEKEKIISYVNNIENSITNKENKRQTEKSFKVKKAIMKRKADDDPDYQEPRKKKLHEYRKYGKKSKFQKKIKLYKQSIISDSTDSDGSMPIRFKSQRLMDKNKIALEPKEVEEPVQRVKRKYTRHVKTFPENAQTDMTNNQLPEELTVAEQFNEKGKMEYLSSHGIYKVSQTANEMVSKRSNLMDVKQSITTDVLPNPDVVKSINFKSNAENILKLSTNNNKTSYLKILPNQNQNCAVRIIGSLNKNENSFTKPTNFHKNLENIDQFPAKSKNFVNNPSQNDLSIESKNMDKPNENLLNPISQINPIQNETNAQNVIIQPKLINANQLKANIVSSSSDTTTQFVKPIGGVNISKVSLSNKDQLLNQIDPQPPIKPKLKLSDVPFECFNVTTSKKAQINNKSRHVNAINKFNNIPKISINSSVQQKNTSINSLSKMQSSIINRNQVKVIQIPKNTNQIIQPSRENFTDQINPIKSTSSSNFRFEPVKLLEKPILSAKSPTIVNSEELQIAPKKIDNFKELMNTSLEFRINPQWTSTPFANRFINSTKHKKSTSESGNTMENKSQSESNKTVDIPNKYLY